MHAGLLVAAHVDLLLHVLHVHEDGCVLGVPDDEASAVVAHRQSVVVLGPAEDLHSEQDLVVHSAVLLQGEVVGVIHGPLVVLDEDVVARDGAVAVRYRHDVSVASDATEGGVLLLDHQAVGEGEGGREVHRGEQQEARPVAEHHCHVPRFLVVIEGHHNLPAEQGAGGHERRVAGEEGREGQRVDHSVPEELVDVSTICSDEETVVASGRAGRQTATLDGDALQSLDGAVGEFQGTVVLFIRSVQLTDAMGDSEEFGDAFSANDADHGTIGTPEDGLATKEGFVAGSRTFLRNGGKEDGGRADRPDLECSGRHQGE